MSTFFQFEYSSFSKLFLKYLRTNLKNRKEKPTIEFKLISIKYLVQLFIIRTPGVFNKNSPRVEKLISNGKLISDLRYFKGLF